MGTRAVVIGAGVVGLAIARQLAVEGYRVTVVDAAPQAGTESSTRNSEIVHGGLYYEPGSLKATLCVAGRQLLYDYCGVRGVTAKKLGKILVATSDDQVAQLRSIKDTAHQNGVTDVDWISVAEVAALEPAVQCVAALISPSTGVVDGRAFMAALQGDAEQLGAAFLFSTAVLSGDVNGAEKSLQVESVRTGEQRILQADIIVNAAGLWAQSIAHRFAGLPPATVPKLHVARGCYFELKGDSPFSHQVYPIPTEAGLGTHATLDVAGKLKFGPDSEWVEWDPARAPPPYHVNPARGDAFYSEIRKYWPALKDGQLTAAYSGLRAKLSGPGQPKADFSIQGPGDHSVDGLVNLYGIESPGLTSSLAIAEMVAGLLTHHPPAKL